MPTGYTADLYDGKDVSFEDFTLGCARAFGALISMRDSSKDAPIPDEFVPSRYHRERIIEIEKRMKEVNEWTPAQAEAEQAILIHKQKLQYKQVEKQDKERLSSYNAMLAQVREWEPPTEEHKGLKNFMIKQLEDSIKHDTGMTFPKMKMVLGMIYKAREIEKAVEDLEYHTKRHREELERIEERNRWVRELRDSLFRHKTRENE